MCGRCACTRDPQEVRHACAYRPRGARRPVKPAWIAPSSQKYYPSYNMSPQTNGPVLLSTLHTHVVDHFQREGGDLGERGEGRRVLQTMKWGLVPSWHRGDPASFPTLLNNCRVEGMMEKASFRNAVNKNQRCVVMVDGFFEWQRGGGQKQPYFIQFADSTPTEEMMEVTAEGEDDTATEIPGGEALCLKVKVTGRMLTMAALFDVWQRGPDEEPLFTYAVITLESHSSFTHIHHRMPAILDGEDALQAWLDPSLPTHQVISLLQPSNALRWHPVSAFVNNVKNKSPECIQPIDPSMKVSSKQNTLLNWFSPAPTKGKGKGPGAQEAGERAEEGGCEQGKRLEEKVPPSKKAKME